MNDPNEMLEQFMTAQRQITEAQEQVARTEVTGSAGGGMVTVTIDGELEVRSVRIDPEVVDPEEVDMLADLVHAAINDALAGVETVRAEALSAGMPDLGALLGGLTGGGGPDALGEGLGGLLGAPPPDQEDR